MNRTSTTILPSSLHRRRQLCSLLGVCLMLLSSCCSSFRLTTNVVIGGGGGVRRCLAVRGWKPQSPRCHPPACSKRTVLLRASTSTSTTTLATDQNLPKSVSRIRLPPHVRHWLDVELPEGRCVGVTMSDLPESDPDAITPEHVADNPNHWVHAAYHPEEIAFGMTLKPASSSSFWMGRLAMRLALGFPDYPILKDSHGRPQLDPKVGCGSISHKQDTGIALVSSNNNSNNNNNNNNATVAGVGVDLELTSRPGKRSIAPRVLTEKERESLGNIPGISAEEEVLLRFSLKEAVYKATHPLLCQYVGFQEAEVTPHADGTATCVWFLESKADKCLINMTAHWRRLDDDGFFLTSASCQKASLY